METRMTTTRRLSLACAVFYIIMSGAIQASDAIIAGHNFTAAVVIIGALGMACAIFSEIIKDVTK